MKVKNKSTFWLLFSTASIILCVLLSSEPLHAQTTSPVVEHRFDYATWYDVAAEVIGVTAVELQEADANQSVRDIAKEYGVPLRDVIRAVYEMEKARVDGYVAEGVIGRDVWTSTKRRTIYNSIRVFVYTDPAWLNISVDAETLWQGWEIDNYQYRSLVSCGCTDLDTYWLTTVEDGTDAQVIQAGVIDTGVTSDDALTVSDHFTNITDAEANGVASLSATYDPLLGIPLTYVIDPSFDVTEDERQIMLTDVGDISTVSIPVVDDELLNLIVNDMSTRIGVDPTDIIVDDVVGVEWWDGSMGCPYPNRDVLQATVLGYQITLRAGDEVAVYHTDEETRFVLCNQLSSDSELLESVLDDVSARTGIDPSDIVVQNALKVEWSDSSLGCPQLGIGYLMVTTPGYLLMLNAGGEHIVYHTDIDTNFLACDEPLNCDTYLITAADPNNSSVLDTLIFLSPIEVILQGSIVTIVSNVDIETAAQLFANPDLNVTCSGWVQPIPNRI